MKLKALSLSLYIYIYVYESNTFKLYCLSVQIHESHMNLSKTVATGIHQTKIEFWKVPPGGWTQILLYMGWCEVSRGPGAWDVCLRAGG